MGAAQRISKTCRKCGQTKSLSDFYQSKSAPDGRANDCKSCKKRNYRQFYRKNKARILESKREKQRIYQQKYRDDGREDKVKQKVRAATRKAVEEGKLIKPDRCKACQLETEVLEAHHRDYSKPLWVVWLCKNCHAQLHAGHDVLGEAT